MRPGTALVLMMLSHQPLRCSVNAHFSLSGPRLVQPIFPLQIPSNLLFLFLSITFLYASSFPFLLACSNSICHKSDLKINLSKLESEENNDVMHSKKIVLIVSELPPLIIEQNFIIRSLGHETRAEMEKMRYPLCTLQFIMHAYTRTCSLTLVLLFCVCTSGQGNDQSYGQHL